MTTNIATTSLEPGVWAMDPAHSSVEFTVRHLMAAKVRGTFKGVTATITVGDNPADSSVTATIDAASVDTGADDRDGHLRSADFFDVENHSTIEFSSTSVAGSEESFEVIGDLTMRGVTKSVKLDASFLGLVSDPWGNEKALFSASTEIDREEWDLTWNQALESGGWLVGKKIKINLEIQAAKAESSA